MTHEDQELEVWITQMREQVDTVAPPEASRLAQEAFTLELAEGPAWPLRICMAIATLSVSGGIWAGHNLIEVLTLVI